MQTVQLWVTHNDSFEGTYEETRWRAFQILEYQMVGVQELGLLGVHHVQLVLCIQLADPPDDPLKGQLYKGIAQGEPPKD